MPFPVKPAGELLVPTEVSEKAIRFPTSVYCYRFTAEACGCQGAAPTDSEAVRAEAVPTGGPEIEIEMRNAHLDFDFGF